MKMTRYEKAEKTLRKLCQEYGFEYDVMAERMNRQYAADAQELIDAKLDFANPEYVKSTFRRITGIDFITAREWLKVIVTCVFLILFITAIAMGGLKD